MTSQHPQQYTVAFETLRCNYEAVSGYLHDRYGLDKRRQELNNLTQFVQSGTTPDRIPIELISQGITALAQTLDEPNLGLRLVSYLEAEGNQIVSFIKRIQLRFVELVYMIARYTHIASQVFEFHIVETADSIQLELSPNSPETVSRHQFEGLMGLIVRSLRLCDQVNLVGIDLPHAQPNGSDELYMEVFGMLPRFDQPKACLHFAGESRNAFVAGTQDAQESLKSLQIFETQYTKLLEDDCLLERSRFLLSLLLCHGEANKERLAELLCVSPRTLQRRLKEQGTSFRELLQDLRKQLSEKHFLYSDATCYELGFALGYQDYKQFHRAFKNWFGVTPEQYRLQLIS